MEERYSDRIRIQDGYQIPERVENGLQAICFCVQGTHRSPNCVLFLNNISVPSVYVVGGLENLANKSQHERLQFFDYATESPNLIFLLDQIDRSDYENILAEIIRKKGTIIINDNFNNIRKTYFPNAVNLR